MRFRLMSIATLFAIGLLAAPASAQLLFGYEDGETGMPYAGNPASYTVSPSNIGVTQGKQSVQASVLVPTFGGPLSAQLDPVNDASALNITNAINNAQALLIDMTVPNKTFNYGNIDLQFFQEGIRGPGLDADETGFSPTFALSSGSTITLRIPLTNTQFGSPRITLDPSKPWAYQVDLAFGVNPGITGFDFQFDNLRVVPEPATWGILSMGAVALGMVRRRRR